MDVVTIGDCVLYHGDCLEVLPTLEAGIVDAVVTDPPYGIGFAAQPTKWSRDNLMRTSESWDNATPDLTGIVSMGVEMAVWGGNHFSLPPSRGWLVWVKPMGLPSYGTAELCWTNIAMPVRHLLCERCNGDKVPHPTQKPIRLMEWTIGFTTGSTVLDPYMGSGTTGVACVRLGRKFIGVEIERKYFDIACRRIAKAYEDRANPLFGEEAPKPVQKTLELGSPTPQARS